MNTPTLTPKKMISHKQLSAAYGVHADTLKKEIKKIKTVKYRKNQVYYSVRQLDLIYSHLGNPFH